MEVAAFMAVDISDMDSTEAVFTAVEDSMEVGDSTVADMSVDSIAN
jgi:hypothetical protein